MRDLEVYSLLFIIGYIMSISTTFKNTKVVEKISFYLLVIVLFILSGLRAMSVGYDNLGHEMIFNYISNRQMSVIGFKDPGYSLMSFAVSFFGGYHLFIIVFSAIMIILLVYSINYFSTYPFISLYVYYCLYFLGNNMAKIRQGMAVVILLVALKHLHQNHKKKYIILVLLASTFHASALLFLILIILIKIDLSRIKMIILLAISLLVGITGIANSVFYNILNNDWVMNITNILRFNRIKSYIGSEYLIRKGGYWGLAYTLINVILIFLLYEKFKLKENDKEIFIAKVYYWGALTSIILFDLPLINQRFSMAFLVTQTFLVTYMISFINNKFKRLIFINSYLLAVLFTGYLAFVTNYDKFVPFKFFWN